MIFVMGVTMLKMENARTKWRIKLQNAFNAQRKYILHPPNVPPNILSEHDRGAKTSKWILFILPMITVLREGKFSLPTVFPHLTFPPPGLEAVVFVSGVSLAQPATSIPIAAIVGIISGLACGVIIYQFASRTSKYILPVNFIRSSPPSQPSKSSSSA